ncbi:MAG: DUF2298 domain-containing protein [Caldilineaceae bacterium]
MQQPSLGYLGATVLWPLLILLALLAWWLGYAVIALCVAPLGAAFLLMWRRGRASDAGDVFAALLVSTGLAILAGTQIVFLKDFLAGGDWYRMNTLFKFFSQVWMLWGVAAAIVLPRFWRGVVVHADEVSHQEIVQEEAAPRDSNARTTASARNRSKLVFAYGVDRGLCAAVGPQPGLFGAGDRGSRGGSLPRLAARLWHAQRAGLHEPGRLYVERARPIWQRTAPARDPAHV